MSFISNLWIFNQELRNLVLIAHYVDDDFVLNKLILNFKKVLYPHINYALNDIVRSCHSELDLHKKIFGLMLENSSTNDAFISKFKRDFSEKLLFNDSHIHLRCYTHILNIMVHMNKSDG